MSPPVRGEEPLTPGGRRGCREVRCHSPKISTPSHLIHLQLYHSFVSLPFFSLFLSLTAQHGHTLCPLPPISLTFPVPCTSVFLSFPTSVYEIFLKRFFKESFPLLYIIPRFTLARLCTLGATLGDEVVCSTTAKRQMQKFSEDTAVVGCAKGGVRAQGAGEGNGSVRS